MTCDLLITVMITVIGLYWLRLACWWQFCLQCTHGPYPAYNSVRQPRGKLQASARVL